MPGIDDIRKRIEEIKAGVPAPPDPTGEALRLLEPGDMEQARRVIEAAVEQYGQVPDVIVMSMLDTFFFEEPEHSEIMDVIERAGWSGGPIL